MLFIGDVHGKTGQYIHLLKYRSPYSWSLQVGDMGLGFKGVGLPPPGASMPTGNHWFIRGNHDSPEKCKQHPNYAGEYGMLFDTGVFFCGGAWSIDKLFRVEGVSWWADEEQSIEALNKAVDLYAEAKPRIVVTHEAPTEAAGYLLDTLIVAGGEKEGYFEEKKGCFNTRTSQALQRMFEIHQPEHWVFGHYHATKNFPIRGTQFHCLAELDTLELEHN